MGGGVAKFKQEGKYHKQIARQLRVTRIFLLGSGGPTTHLV